MVRRALILASVLALSGCSMFGGRGDTTASVVAPNAPTGVEAVRNSETVNALANSRTFGSATQIPAVVNGEPITKLMVDRRTAFLKLRRAKKQGRAAARDELIEDALKLQEGRRRSVTASPERVNAAYASFAKNNKLSLSQLNTILNQAGVTPDGFKDYIRAQITWSSLAAQRGSGGGAVLTERDAVTRMLEAGGEKPTATEYLLQQVIFVVPENRRSKATIEARRREANALRSRFTSCDKTVEMAGALRDVAIRDLGRKVGPELPSDWKSLIVKTQPGGTTDVRTTARGVEFIGVCRAREVSDDRTARLVFAAQDAARSNGDASAQYLADLRKKATIQKR